MIPLSDKIIQPIRGMDSPHVTQDEWLIRVGDVKKFVKELKTILNMNGELTEIQINHLAGDALCVEDEQ